GYHDLDSVVTLVTLGDDVFLERRREGVSLEMICEGATRATDLKILSLCSDFSLEESYTSKPA
ncbi:MAG: hypothetical protein IKB66_04905, partial [Clostridia bacterium]|nr:hypothetical protein [Clostridia bacterium]